MPYSIREGVEDSHKRLVAEKAIAERYPDAVLDDLPDGRRVWSSVKATTDTNDFDIVLSKDKADTTFCPFLEVEGMRVYGDPWKWKASITVLHEIRKNHPDLQKGLLKLVKE